MNEVLNYSDVVRVVFPETQKSRWFVEVSGNEALEKKSLYLKLSDGVTVDSSRRSSEFSDKTFTAPLFDGREDPHSLVNFDLTATEAHSTRTGSLHVD